MFRLVLGLALILVLVSSTYAQQPYPKWNLFAGYSYRTTNQKIISFAQPALSEWEKANGWGLNLTYNLHKNIGVTADLAGQYGRRLSPIYMFPLPTDASAEIHNFSTYQFLFGPRFSFRTGRVTQFAQTLVGGFRSSGGAPDTSFAMGFGGGMDIELSKRIAIRAFQADYIPVREFGWRHHVRLETGIVLNFGR
jgi:hypothetical protein